MTANQTTSTTAGAVVGVFDERRQAEAAVADLERAGFTDDQIGFVTHDRDGGSATSSGGSGRGGEVTTDTG